jgi:replicative DNA helicase
VTTTRTKPTSYTPAAARRTPPLWDEDIEQSVLAALLMDGSVADAARLIVAPEHFYAQRHARLFEAMLAVLDAGARLDPHTLCDELTRRGTLEACGGKEYVGYLMDAVPTAANIEYHARIVRDFADRRATIAALRDAAEVIATREQPLRDTAAALQSTLLPIAAESGRRGFVHVKEDLWPLMEAIEARARGDAASNLIPTGYPEIDDAIGGGFRRAELVFLAGVPGGLKTATAMNIAINVANEAEDVCRAPVGAAIVSAEMTRAELHERNLARLGQVPYGALRNGRLADADYPRLARAAGMLGNLPLWVDETPRPTLDDTAAKCRHLKSQHPEIGLVVVDFVQLMQHRMGPRQETNRALELTDISYGLAGLAKELDVVMLATCQVDAQSVDRREVKRPRLEDLRWSQAMREAGHFIGLCYRPAMYDPDAPDDLDINFAKARGAPPFQATLHWIGQFMMLDSRRRRARDRGVDER